MAAARTQGTGLFSSLARGPAEVKGKVTFVPVATGGGRLTMRFRGVGVERSKPSGLPSADLTSVTLRLGCSSTRTELETSRALKSTLATAERDWVMVSSLAETS